LLKFSKNGAAGNNERLTIEFSVMYNISIYCFARGDVCEQYHQDRSI
jgi:hypothetical protein